MPHSDTTVPLRIAIQIRGLALGAGGMERTAVKLANELVYQGDQVALIFVRADHPPLYEIDPRVTLLSIPPSELDPQRHAQAAVDFCADVVLHLYPNASALPYLREVAEAGLPLVLHEGTNPERLLGLGWADRQGIPRPMAEAQRQAISAVAAQVRVTMPSYRDSFPADLRDRVIAFPNAFPAPSPQVAALHGDPDRPRRFIQIGGLKPNKNLLPAIHGFLSVADELPGWRFAIFSADTRGDSIRPRLEEVLAEHPRGDRVDIFAPTSHIDREYAMSDAHVIPSLSEGLPNCLAEAICHGLPSIGFACCEGTNELIVDGVNGILLPCDGDMTDERAGSDQLGAAMRLLAQNDNLRARMGAAALRDAAMFEPARIYRTWRRVLSQAARAPAYPQRLLDGDPILADAGAGTVGRALVTGMGFATLPATLRPPVSGRWQSVPAGDALGADAAATDAAADATPVVIWLDAGAAGDVSDGAVTTLARAPDGLNAAAIRRISFDAEYLHVLGLSPAHPWDADSTQALGLAPAIQWRLAAGLPPPPTLDMDAHLGAIAQALAGLRQHGALASASAATQFRITLLAGLEAAAGGAPLGQAGVAAWRAWLDQEPRLTHRMNAKSADLALRTALIGLGAGERVMVADWRADADGELSRRLQDTPLAGLGKARFADWQRVQTLAVAQA